MAIFWYISLLTVLLVLYYLVKKKNGNSNREYVQCVEAGPMDNVDAETLKRLSFYDRHAIIRDDKGAELSSDRYARIVVNGNCMNERDIFDGDQLVAEKISERNESHLKKILEKNNIVWLYIDETKINKIRVFDKWENGELKTYYFKNGGKHYSSLNHKASQVRGIVRYKME